MMTASSKSGKMPMRWAAGESCCGIGERVIMSNSGEGGWPGLAYLDRASASSRWLLSVGESVM